MKRIVFILVLLSLFLGLFIFRQFAFRPQTFSEENASQVTHSATSATTDDTDISTGTLIDSTFQDSFSKSSISASNAGFYQPAQNIPPVYDVDEYEVRFTSSDSQDEPLEIKAQLFVPKGAEGKQLPLYVFGQGTTGIGDQCAPSRENVAVSNWGNYQAHMLSYASQGYIVMFPDYEGFNDPERIHHYFNDENEARVLLDGARATYAFIDEENPGAGAAQSVFFAGYSQGGHAALAVKDTAARYAPDVPVKGVIGYGATADMIALLKENPTLAPYVIYAYADLYGQDVITSQQVFLPDIVSTFERDVPGTCIGDIYRRYGYDAKAIYNPAFYDALYNNKLDVAFPAFKKALDENSSGYAASSIPALILQGSTDPIITVKSQKEYLEKVCEAGNTITYTEYPGIHHYQTRQVSFRDTLSWMENIRNGNVPESDCSAL